MSFSSLSVYESATITSTKAIRRDALERASLALLVQLVVESLLNMSIHDSVGGSRSHGLEISGSPH